MKKKLITLSALTLSLLLVISSCGSKSYESMATDSVQNSYAEVYKETELDYDNGGFNDYKAEEESTDGITNYVSEPSEPRKIIYTSSYTIETTEYDNSITNLEKLCAKYGAYYEKAESYGTKENANRNSNFVVRVPVENYNEFKGEAGNIGVITRSSENNRDVTEMYVDTEARLQSAKLREERLLEILAKADTLDDVLLLERELSDVRYEIESMSGSLRKYDSLISYSTIEIYIREVVEAIEIKPVPKTYGQKVLSSLMDGFDNFTRDVGYLFLDFLYNLPGIIIFVVTIVIFYVIIKKISRKNKNKTTKNAISANNQKENEECSK